VNNRNFADKLKLKNKPYFAAINDLNKLNLFWNPREKLNTLLSAVSQLKSAIVDFHYGKIELESMDDQLPLLIYIVLQSTVTDFVSELKFIEDFISFDQQLDDESQLITNILVSV